jgi:hypothetical protein
MSLFRVVCFLILLPFFPTPGVMAGQDVFLTSYECSDLKGNPRWKAFTEIFASPEKGEGFNTLIEKASGRYTGFKQDVSWRSELVYKKQGHILKPVRSQTVTSDMSGELLSIETQEFDYANNTVTFKRDDRLSGKESSKVFRIREDIVNRLLLGLYIQQFLKSGKEEAFIEILSNEPRLIRCRLYILGKEDIEISKQARQAYKLCLDPQMGLLSFIKILIPSSYVWHSAAGEFEWLKYKGLESDLNSPIVEIKKTENNR